MAVVDEGDGDIDTLEQALGVNSAQDETTLVQGFGTLGRGANADGREGMANGGEEGGFFRQGAGIRHDGKGIHL